MRHGTNYSCLQHNRCSTQVYDIDLAAAAGGRNCNFHTTTDEAWRANVKQESFRRASRCHRLRFSIIASKPLPDANWKWCPQMRWNADRRPVVSLIELLCVWLVHGSACPLHRRMSRSCRRSISSFFSSAPLLPRRFPIFPCGFCYSSRPSLHSAAKQARARSTWACTAFLVLHTIISTQFHLSPPPRPVFYASVHHALGGGPRWLLPWRARDCSWKKNHPLLILGAPPRTRRTMRSALPPRWTVDP
jgi:hypothetical protein